MNDEEIARCQKAIELAESGQKHTAYREFCALYNQGNAGDTTLLSWIAYTTTSFEEAQRAIVDIARLEPEHPRLDYLCRYVSRRQQRGDYAQPIGRMGPMLQCPYCHYLGPARIAQKISTGGWIFFVVFLCIFFPICWIGFLIKKDYYACGSCGIALGDITV